MLKYTRITTEKYLGIIIKTLISRYSVLLVRLTEVPDEELVKTKRGRLKAIYRLSLVNLLDCFASSTSF
jgi:hypothetical protein